MSGREKTVRTPVGRIAVRFFANRAALICLGIFLIILLACLIIPLFPIRDPEKMNMEALLQAPNGTYWMGTDIYGRDLLSRMLHGGRLTFNICFTAAGLSLFGLVLGVAAGFFGGRIDRVISRFNDAVASIPIFLLAVFIEMCLPAGQGNYKYAIAVALMPPLVRLSRNLVLEILDSEYIEAARALGVSPVRIAAGHVLRNISGPVIVQVFTNLSDAILTCTIMGYLGLGVRMPRVEWGTIVKEGFQCILRAPLQIVLPCLVIFACVLSLNVVGNALRDAVAKEER